LEKDKNEGIKMADDKEKIPKIVLEREYNIPLRRKYLLVPRHKRTNKAVKTARQFLEKHMKSANIKLGKYLNLEFWKHGARNPPHHVAVIAKKDEDGVVTAEIKGAPTGKKSEKKVEEKKEAPKAEAKAVPKAEEKKEATKVEAPAEEKKEETKPEVKPAVEAKPVDKKD